jgi:hypothetical protein
MAANASVPLSDRKYPDTFFLLYLRYPSDGNSAIPLHLVVVKGYPEITAEPQIFLFVPLKPFHQQSRLVLFRLSTLPPFFLPHPLPLHHTPLKTSAFLSQ